MTTRIKLRRDTAANWTSNDPVLALGEACYDTTHNQLRVGDGISPWSLLSAVTGTSNKITAEKDYSLQYSNEDVALFTYTTGSIAVQFYPNVGQYLNDLLSRWIDYFSGDTSLASNYSNVALVINSDTTPIASTVTNVTSNSNDPTLYTITLASAPAGPITIDTINFNYTFTNAIGLDNDNAYYGMAVADENINFHSGRDINLYAADDFRMYAGNNFILQLKNLDDMNPDQGIEINTSNSSTDYTWTFRLDGGLGLPDTGLIDNNGGITRFKSTDNDGVQLGSTDDQNYVTVNTSSVTIQTNSDALGGSTQYNWVFGTNGSLSLPANTVSTATTTGGVIKIKGSVRTLPGDIPIYGIPGTSSDHTTATDTVIWTADSVLVTAAKITLRVAYYNTQATGWDNTEIIELLITKTNPGQGGGFTGANIAVIGRVKSNAAYADSTVDWDYGANNCLVLLSTPDATKAADCNIYWNYDVVAFEHTLD